jgi:hypothetical protein
VVCNVLNTESDKNQRQAQTMSKVKSRKKYRVLINGQNFLLTIDGKARKSGFYTTRLVEAQDAKEAEIAAVELIKSDSKLKDIALNERGDSPMLYVEEVEEVKKLRPALGYAFYSEEEDAP